MSNLSKAVVEPKVKCMWSRESRGGCECPIGKQREDVIPIRLFPVYAPRWGL